MKHPLQKTWACKVVCLLWVWSPSEIISCPSHEVYFYYWALKGEMREVLPVSSKQWLEDLHSSLDMAEKVVWLHILVRWHESCRHPWHFQAWLGENGWGQGFILNKSICPFNSKKQIAVLSLMNWRPLSYWQDYHVGQTSLSCFHISGDTLDCWRQPMLPETKNIVSYYWKGPQEIKERCWA
jgi:hypothetical protein